jgi:hypothetical protein
LASLGLGFSRIENLRGLGFLRASFVAGLRQFFSILRYFWVVDFHSQLVDLMLGVSGAVEGRGTVLFDSLLGFGAPKLTGFMVFEDEG